MATLFFNVEADYSKVVQLRNEINRLETQMSNFNASTSLNQIAEYEKRLASAKTQMQALVNAAAHTGQTFQTSFVSEVSKASQSFSDLNRGIAGARGELGSLGQGIGSFVQQFTAAALAVKGLQMAVGAIKGASDTVIEFQAANSLLRAVTGETEEGLNQMRERAEELGRTTVFTASQVTQLEIALAKLGFQREQILDMSGSILQYAQATGASLDDAASNAGAALRMFGAESSEITRYVGAMSAAINSSALNFQAVSENLATFGPVAKSVGLDIEEALAIFGKLKDAGYNGSTAATSVRNILNEMAGGKIAKELGHTVTSFEDFIKALDELEAKGYSGTEAVGKAMKAVGKRGGAQLLTLIQQKDGLKELYQRIKEGEGNTGELAQTMNDNVAGSIKLLQSAWEGFVLSFSNSTGFMSDLLKQVTDGINGMTNLVSQGTGRIGADEMNSLIGIVIGLTSAFAVYKAELIGIEAIERVRAALGATEYARYQQMVAQLQAVTMAQSEELSVGLESAVQKGVLTKEQAQYIASLRATAAAEYEALKAQLAKAQAEEADSIALAANMRIEQQRAMAAVASARASGNASAIEAAQRRLLQANVDMETAAEIRNTASTNVNTISKRASAAGAALDATAKGVDTAATWTLTGAIDALTASMAACPLMWIAIAVGALAFGIYKLSTMTDTATAAQDVLNESLKEFEDELSNAKTEAEGWIRTMEDNTATALQQVEAYEKLKAAYEDFGNYTPEEIKNMTQEERSEIMNRSNEKQEQEFLDARLEMYRRIKDLYATDPFHTNKDENLIISELGVSETIAQRLQKELDSVRESVGNITSNMSKKLIPKAQEASEGYKAARNEAEVYASLDAMGGIRQTNLNETQQKRYHSLMGMMEGQANANGYLTPVGITKDNKTYNALASEIEQLTKERVELTNAIYSETDEGKRNSMKSQMDDMQALINLYTSVARAMENGGRGVAEAFKRFAETNDTMRTSSETAIVLGDAYKRTMDIMGELSLEQEKNGEVSEETAERSKIAVTEEISNIEAKIKELEDALADPKLTEAKRQQIKVDLVKSNQTLADVKSLLREIENAVKIKSFHIIINIIRRFINKDENDKRGQRAQAAIEEGNKAKADAVKKTDDDKKDENEDEDEKKRKKRLAAEKKASDAEEMMYQNRIKREREIEDAKMKSRKADIDGMEESVQKSVRLAEYQRDKTLMDIKRTEESKRYELYKTAKAEWETKNEGAYRKSRNAFQVSPEEKAMYTKQAELAEKTYTEAVKKAYKAYSPEDERASKIERYQRDIIAMQEELNKARIKGNKEDIRFWQAKIMYAQNLIGKLSDHSMSDFYVKYGNIDQRREATDSIYRSKIQDAQNDPNKGEGDILALRMEWAKAISEIDFDKLKEDINWEAVFGDLDRISVEHLQTLKSNLREYLGQDLPVDQYKDIANAIDDINQKLLEKQSLWRRMFGAVNPYVDRLRLAKEEVEEANKNLEQQKQALNLLVQTKNIAKAQINSLVKGNGEVSDDTTSESFRSMISGMPIEQQTRLLVLFEELMQLVNRQKAQEERVENAEGAKSDADEGLENTQKDFKSKLEGFSNALGLVNANMQSLPDLLESFGVDMESKAAKGIMSLAESSNFAASAIKNLASGNIVGAVSDSMNMLGSLGNALGNFGIKGFGDSDPELKKRIEHLTNSNKDLEKAISELSDEISKSDTKNATTLYTQSQDYVKQEIANTQRMLKDSADAYSNGFLGVGGSHSSRYKIDDAMSDADWRRISEVTGVSVRNASDFISLSSESMSKVAINATDLWTKIKEAGASGKEDISEYLEGYIELYKKLEELEEQYLSKMTSMSFDSLKDDFNSVVSDMYSTAEDFTDSFEDMMRKAVINSMLDEAFESRLKEWRKNLADAIATDGLDRNELEELKNEYLAMGEEYSDLRNQLYEELGLDDVSASQRSSTKSVGNMTQDTAEEISGRMTGIHMSVESVRMNDAAKLDIPLSQLNDTLLQQYGSIIDIKTAADEAREYIVLSYLELQGINENTSVMASIMKDMAKNITKVKDNTQSL